MTTYPKYASVILDVKLGKPLDYGVPADIADLIKRGQRVEIPLRGRLAKGYVYGIKDAVEFNKVLPIKRIISKSELITEDLFELALWISNYYYAPLSQVLKIMLPSSIRKEVKPKEQLFVMRAKTKDEIQDYCRQIRNKSSPQAKVLDELLMVKKGILLSELLEKTEGSRSPVDTLVKKGYLVVDIVRIDRSPLINEEYFQTKPKTLNDEQKNALEKIIDTLDKETFRTHLLYGVTGSGKTEVYLQALQRALDQGKGAIVLVPEISLTAQTIERFRSRFKEKIAILHHRLSDGERSDEWTNIQNGSARIVIGARSAIFSPVKNLGLIIVDEEHENSYKQNEEAPFYHARDVAVMRGKITKSAVILGSATPSLESFQNANTGKYTLSQLHNRAEASAKAKVTVVDMKREFERNKGYTNFSEALLDGIKKRQEAGEQSILFLNRRGYHTTLFCQECREPVQCRHCDTTLTFHMNSNVLTCHLCGYTLSPPPKACPQCSSVDMMKFRGVGTELLERSLHAIFPDLRTIRIDGDTTRHKGSHQRLLRDFGSGKADVLIGTQMIAKGLHFPEVTLVGVINCDTSLNIPDFRASETVFQLITQVAGRAGRGVLPGEVILQTCMPDNSTIKLASDQDFLKFFEEEVAVREYFDYPPFSHLVKISFSGPHEQEVLSIAQKYRSLILQHLPNSYTLNPVVASGHAKVKDRYRFQFLIKGPAINSVIQALEKIGDSFAHPSRIRRFIDVNPLSTFF